MPVLSDLTMPLAAPKGIEQSLKVARAANPRSSSTFGGELDRALSSLASGQFDAVGIGAGVGSTQGAPLDGGYAQATAQFETLFRRAAFEAGLDLDNGVLLQADERGEVRVIGDHVNKQAIEQLFRDNPELRLLYQQLENQASLVFERPLSSPTAIAHSFADLESSARFALHVKPNGVEVRFA